MTKDDRLTPELTFANKHGTRGCHLHNVVYVTLDLSIHCQSLTRVVYIQGIPKYIYTCFTLYRIQYLLRGD